MTKGSMRLYRSYFIGFGLSFVLTMGSFAVVSQQVASGGATFSDIIMVVVLLVLAIVQLVVQLLFFFHLGREPKPRLNTISFLFMLTVVGTIGIGSLWIMYNLDYNMMPRDVETHIEIEENIKKPPVPHQHP